METHFMRNDSGTIRHGNTRHVEITLQQNLVGASKNLLNDHNATKQHRLQDQPDEAELFKQKILPEFLHQAPKPKRKTKAVFHENLKYKEFKMDQYLTLPTIPAYSPIDEGARIILESRSRKYPYIQKKMITTEDMRKPRVSSLGVIPVRLSSEIPNLRVMLEGVPATLDGMEAEPKLYNTPATSFVISNLPVEEMESQRENKIKETGLKKERRTHEREEEKTKEEAPVKKPAILPGVGTTAAVKLSERAKPMPKPSYLHAYRKKRKVARETCRPNTGQSFQSSLLSGEISFVGGADDFVDHLDNDDVETAVGVSERQHSQNSKDGSVLSVEELLEEAQRITSFGLEHTIYQDATGVKDSIPVSDRDKPARKKLKEADQSSKRHKKSKERKVRDPKGNEPATEQVIEMKREERTVDEIIASLRDQSAYNKESEADRKIREIMNRVMSRTHGHPVIVLDDEEVSESANISEKDELVSGGEDENMLLGADLEHRTTSSASASDIMSQNDGKLMEYNNAVSSSETFHETPKDNFQIPEKETKRLSAMAQVTETIPDWSEDFEVKDEQDQSQDEDTDGEITEPLSIQQAWEDLLAPPEVTVEDILSVHGEVKEIHECRLPASSISFLSTWTPAGTRQTDPAGETVKMSTTNIHHFCCMTMEYQLPQALIHVGRKYHTPDRFPSVKPDQPYRFKPGELTPLMERENSSTDSSTRIEHAASRVFHSVSPAEEKENESPSTLLEWQRKANSVFSQARELELSVIGETMQIKTDETQVYWSLAPPKLEAAPHRVREILFPQYHIQELSEFGQLRNLQFEDQDGDSSEEEECISAEDKAALERTVLKRHNSAELLTVFSKEKAQVDAFSKKCTMESVTKTPIVSTITTTDDVVTDAESSTLEGLGVKFTDPAILDGQKVGESVQGRPRSAPTTLSDGESIIVRQDFSSALDEIKEQKKLLEKAKKQMQVQEVSNGVDGSVEQKEVVNVPPSQDIDAVVANQEPKTVKSDVTLAEEALQAGRNYVILTKKRKKKIKIRKLDSAKIEAVEKTLMTKPMKKLVRHESMPKLSKVIEREIKVSWKIRSHRHSIPDLLNFEEYKTRKRMPAGEDEREWVRGIWNEWFDQVFPPSREDSDEEASAASQDQKSTEMTEETKLAVDTVSEILSQDVIEIEPIMDTSENKETYQIILEEIEKLNCSINGAHRPTAFDFCRRGALYRKIGQLRKAEMDLNRAIQMEPELLDAYWHRHLLYLLQDRKSEAVDDLNFILKRNKHHSGAYRSMAEIYKRQNDTTMAVINYSSAIKFNPLDHEAYFQRAQMYEQRGDMLLAMEDYAKAMKIMPSRTDIIMKHAMYYFENKNWQNAVADLTQLLKADPLSATAHLLRGQAFIQMNNWVSALQDVGAAIHLDPHSWQAFYLRASILRKAHPRKAIQDYSVSLLLNDSEENLMSYMYRGILYNTLGKPEYAIADFESALKLNKDLAPAHVNLGLIYMIKQSNFHRAIKKFTAALSVDPTYVRAYVCRAEAYHKIHKLKKALKDFTRAIHLRPDVHYYYMYRGQLLLELGSLDLAAFCVYHASEIGMSNPESTFGGSPSQQAVVQSFLKNYDKAVDALEQATRIKPIAPYFLLLGKTHMKAKQFKEAINSFQQALDKMRPLQKQDTWPPETSDAHYWTGLCHMELCDYSDAHQQFNLALKFNPSCADAYYQRGLASMKLGQLKGILDFNRALALDPKIFQAYLSRACFYGMKGKFAKAILNCNEALKIKPMSLRAYLYRGSLKYRIKAYELAILDLTKATAIDTQCPVPYYNRAICYHETGQFDKALTDYSIVLLLGDTLMLKVLINRGLLYYAKQDFLNSLSDFQAAVKISPKDHLIHHTLGLCLHKLNRLKESVTVFSRCLQLDPFFLDGLLARGNAFMDYGNEFGLKFAKRDYQRALRLDPFCLPARINLAYAAQMSGKQMQAWKHFTSIIEVKPNYKPALEGRAIVNLQMSNTFGAYQDISQSIKYGPTAELLTNRGVISQFMGDRVMAMNDYQQAVKLDPAYALAYYNAGNVYFHTRHFRQALDYYDKAIRYNPKDDSAFLNRAITKVLLHDTEGALADFKMAAKLSPRSAHIFFNRANLYASLQRYNRAEKDYTRALNLKPDDALMLKKRADVRGKLGRPADAIEDYKRAVDIQTRPHKIISM